MTPDITDRYPLKSIHSSSNNNATDQLDNQFELILNWYRANGQNLIGEEDVMGLHITKLLSVLGNPIWNEIYHCWAIEPKHMPELQPFIQHQFNHEQFVYFIEAYSTN